MIHEPTSTARARCLRDRRAQGRDPLNTFRDPEINSMNEIPERFHNKIDARRFGVGERVVFLPYSREMFETTQSWMHDRKLFDVGPEVGVSYNKAVRS